MNDADDKDRLLAEAATASDAGDWDQALRALDAVLNLPVAASALVYRRRAEALIHLERYDEAGHDCTAALKLNPNLGSAWKLRGRVRAQLTQWAEALLDFREALKLDFDDETNGLASEVEVKAALAGSLGQLWEIVGGTDKGGVIVRESRETTSSQLGQRLATGSLVLELHLVGDRLHYKRVTGTGPLSGWVSTSLKDKVLACRATAGKPVSACAEDALESLEPPCPEATPADVLSLSEREEQRQRSLVEDASVALGAGDIDQALLHLSSAVSIGCASALLYSRRAEVLLRLDRPKAAANDCTAALNINPDQAKAFKIRARANAKLFRWTEAHSDFQAGLALDYDDATYEESKPVADKVRDMRVVATERRARQNEADEQKQLAKAQAEKAAKINALRENEEKAAKIKFEKEMIENKFAKDPIFKLAKKQGYMTDFMGMKRGACKCSRCDFYLWRPVRVNS